MLYSAFLIPIIISVIGILIFSKKIVIGELLANIVITSLIIVGVFFIFKNATVADSEYNSYLITEARYYEPWETYVHKTCYRTVSCGKNCTTTVAYDCSYCDYNPAYYELIENGGNSAYAFFYRKSVCSSCHCPNSFSCCTKNIRFIIFFEFLKNCFGNILWHKLLPRFIVN